MTRKPPKPAPSARKPVARRRRAQSASQGRRRSRCARYPAAAPKSPSRTRRPRRRQAGAWPQRPRRRKSTAAAAHKSAAPVTASSISADLRRGHGLPEDRQSQLKLLIARGKEQGYLTYAQVNDHLPAEIVDPEQIEGIVNTINDMGIPVYEKAPDTESLLASEPPSPADDEAIEEAAAALAALDAELGRTTDPVRMYMREMGTVELLTREGEIRIAKRIEEGLDAVRTALAKYPATFEHLLTHLRTGQGRSGAPDRSGGRLHRSRMRPTSSRSRRIRPRSTSRPTPRTRTTTPRMATRPKRRRSIPVRIRRKSRAAWLRSPSCSAGRWPRSPSSAPTIPRRRNCARSSRRVHGTQALAAHVRCADRPAALAHQRDPPDRKGDHDHRGARLRHAAQGFHRHLPEDPTASRTTPSATPSETPPRTTPRSRRYRTTQSVGAAEQSHTRRRIARHTRRWRSPITTRIRGAAGGGGGGTRGSKSSGMDWSLAGKIVRWQPLPERSDPP